MVVAQTTTVLRLGVLASGRGTALEALLQAIAAGDLRAEVALVLTDRRHAPVLERAARYGVRAEFIDPAGLSRETYDRALHDRLKAAGVTLVLMAGYMRIVSHGFVESWRGRLLNVHPSLLPAFAGQMDLKVHQAVLASGVRETGCTIHQVSEAVDAGEIVLQKHCPVLPGDTAEMLKERVQALENEAFVEVVRSWTNPVSKAGTASLGTAADRRSPLVGIVMGSRSDWPTMQEGAGVLDMLEIPYEAEVVSAHRTPERMVRYAKEARGRGLQVIIAGAGGAAHLPGMIAALTSLPVLGVPVQSRTLQGMDSLLSIVQMPGGVPVATFAIGAAGAKNAGLFAGSLLALRDPGLAERLDLFRQRQTEEVLAAPDPRA